MGQQLERQIEQANATARSSHRVTGRNSKEHVPSGSGSSRRKKPGLVVDAEAPGANQPQDQSNTMLVEVMRELNRVKRELRELKREVKAEVDGDADAGSRPLDSAEREAGEGNEESGIAELAVLRRDRRLGASDPDERFATACSSDVGLQSANTAVVPSTEETDHAVNAESALSH
ncbi:unnamed protein product [Miscanthus lutarioriparius]|uniref:Uncharacterized protein n=1 Tax=Miscanthus lutarioriparius TaxID=422564 RepID=A0A811RI07_9POAL|nr:unnamed protein product [Miscanthus lutarioriparius]